MTTTVCLYECVVGFTATSIIHIWQTNIFFHAQPSAIWPCFCLVLVMFWWIWTPGSVCSLFDVVVCTFFCLNDFFESYMFYNHYMFSCNRDYCLDYWFPTNISSLYGKERKVHLQLVTAQECVLHLRFRSSFIGRFTVSTRLACSPSWRHCEYFRRDSRIQKPPRLLFTIFLFCDFEFKLTLEIMIRIECFEHSMICIRFGH